MSNVGTWIAGAALVVGIGALAIAAGAQGRVADLRAELTDRDTQIAAVDERSRDVRRALDAVSAAVRGNRNTDHEAALRRLEERIAALSEEVAQLGDAPGRAVATDGERPSDARAADAAEFGRLRTRVLGGRATDEESRRFWELARTSDALTEILAELTSAVEQSPRDVDARLRLASAIVARLWSVPNGPERGAWAARAEAQWREILTLDESHWGARYSLGFSLSQWPDFMGKRGEAVEVFEDLRERQESGRAEPAHRNTYLRLAELYQRQGHADKARDALRAGLERHPGDEALERALTELE